MKKNLTVVLMFAMTIGILTGCGQSDSLQDNITNIVLDDGGITVNGAFASTDSDEAVYVAKDIVFYLADQGFTYGEGEKKDEHSQEEADAHTVVHITKPGIYALSGSLSAGQIAVDLGKDAKKNPEAVVTLYLNGVDVTCDVAPGVIFYNVYECGTKDEESATKDVDTSAAGANVIIADDTVNTVNGSYVARIYKSYTLNTAGTEVIDNKKLHKYDAAFYSKMSMNIDGGEKDSGILNINAENEGLDSELHLTINGGNININSGNDGINTNEDEVSVTTINDGALKIIVNGSTGEGDGIDSNGWLVINGGSVIASACGSSMDSGIDSDMGIHIKGGNVIASGNMLDRIEDKEQPYVIFSVRDSLAGNETYEVKDSLGKTITAYTPENSFSNLVVSSEAISESATYTLWQGERQIAESIAGMKGFGGPRQRENNHFFNEK